MSLSRLYQSGTVSVSVPASVETLTPPVPRGLFQRLLRLPAWLLPLGLCASFGVVFAVVYRDQLLPAPAVRVSRAVLLADLDQEPAASAPATPAEGAPAAAASKMLFQAGGWVEPDPLPIHAVALTDGVIEKVYVLEGQEVRKGQIIAELIDEDAQLALRAVTQSLAEASASTQLQEVQI
ncbi:MAG: biotin/lipoyl-binding protein, partial [Verrucomicrobium sp.]